MKKFFFWVALVVMGFSLIVPGQLFAKDVLKLGFGDPINSDQGALAKQFKYLVEGYTNGETQVELFAGSSLGNETEMLQNTRSGELDLCMVSSPNLTPFSKEFQILTFPYTHRLTTLFV